jgi:hypothetical protein
LTEPERIDFKKVIADLKKAGIGTGKLANMLHRHPTQIKRWMNNGRVLHYEGQMILEIYREFVSHETTTQNVTDESHLTQSQA